MARPLRIEHPNACYHVMNRGNRSQKVFPTDHHCQLFIDRLDRFCETFNVRVLSYCLMPTHFHLNVRTPDANLSRFMQSLLTSYATAHNRREQAAGHLFQGRFKALLIDTRTYGAEVSRYIHLNPARSAGHKDDSVAALRRLVREHPWSSYGAVIGLRPCPGWLDQRAFLQRWGSTLAEQQEKYAAYVERGLTADNFDPFEAAAAGAVLGSDTFIDRIRRRIGKGSSPTSDVRRELGQNARLLSWIDVTSLTKRVADFYGVPRNSLLKRHSRNNEPRQALLYLASKYSRGQCSLTEIAHECNLTVGGLCRAREVMEQRIGADPELRNRLTVLRETISSAAQ